MQTPKEHYSVWPTQHVHIAIVLVHANLHAHTNTHSSMVECIVGRVAGRIAGRIAGRRRVRFAGIEDKTNAVEENHNLCKNYDIVCCNLGKSSLMFRNPIFCTIRKCLLQQLAAAENTTNTHTMRPGWMTCPNNTCEILGRTRRTTSLNVHLGPNYTHCKLYNPRTTNHILVLASTRNNKHDNISHRICRKLTTIPGRWLCHTRNSRQFQFHSLQTLLPTLLLDVDNNNPRKECNRTHFFVFFLALLRDASYSSLQQLH